RAHLELPSAADSQRQWRRLDDRGDRTAVVLEFVLRDSKLGLLPRRFGREPQRHQVALPLQALPCARAYGDSNQAAGFIDRCVEARKAEPACELARLRVDESQNL